MGGRWEVLGFFLDPKYEPLTPSTMHIVTEPFDFPKTIIKEGKLFYKELQQTQKDEDWVVTMLERLYQTEVKNVLLATLDRKDNLKVFLYS